MDTDNGKHTNTKTDTAPGQGVALKAGVWYVVSTVVVRMITVVTTPIFTRIMSTEEYGAVATFSSWYSILLTVFTLNLTYSVGRAKLDFPGKLDEYIGSVQLLSLFVSTVICLLGLTSLRQVAALLSLSTTATLLLFVYLISAPVVSFVQNGYRYRYQYKQNIAIAIFIAVSTVLLSLALIFCLPGDRSQLRMIGIVVPHLLLGAVFWVRSIRRGWVKINLEYWKYGAKLSVPLVLHAISLHILAQSDRIFITKICGSSYTAIYSLVYSYGMLISTLMSAMADGWLPWFHDNYFAKNFLLIKTNARYMAALCSYIGLACIAVAPEVIYILGGEAYADGIQCVLPIVLGIVCQQIYTHYVNIELHLKRTYFVSAGTIFAAVINMVLNAIFIPKYGYVAAAYTTFFSYIVLLLAHFFITRTVLHVKLYDDLFLFGCVAVVSMASLILVRTYDSTGIRYALVGIGFLSFILAFRKFILQFAKKTISPHLKK